MRLLFTAAMVLLASTAEAKWLRAESAHFIGYLDGSESLLRSNMERLEKFDQLLRSRMGVGANEGIVKLTIYFVSAGGTVKELYGGSDNSVVGFYVPTLSGGMAVVPKSAGNVGSALSPTVVLFHEYVHHFMFQHLRGAPPAWYAEGYAELLSTMEFDRKGQIQLGLPAKHRAASTLFKRDVPIRELLTSTFDNLKGIEGDAYYGRAWLLTHYLLFGKQRAGQLETYLTLISQGMPALKSAESAFGDLDALNNELNHYVTADQFAFITIAAQNDLQGPTEVTALSAGEAEIVLLRFAITRGTGPEEAAERVAQVQRVAAKYPSDPQVLTLLAEAESDARNYDAAIAAADAALKLNEQIGRAHMWKGKAIMDKLLAANDKDPAKWQDARASIVRANRINKNDPEPLYFYYKSFEDEGVEPTENAIKGLGRAQWLVPQYPLLTMEYARALANSKKYDDACVILETLANAPHDSGYKKAAAKMIEEIRAAMGGTQSAPASTR